MRNQPTPKQIRAIRRATRRFIASRQSGPLIVFALPALNWQAIALAVMLLWFVVLGIL